MASPYEELRQQGKTTLRGRPRQFSPEVAKARSSEKTRREAEARRRASIVLAHRHEDEWQELLTAEREAVNSERGALPGDEE